MSNNVYVPSETEDLNIHVFNITTGINKSKTVTKHISFEWKCKFDGRKCYSNQELNMDKCRCKCKKHHICEKDYIWYPATCTCKNGKYLSTLIDDWVIACDEIIYAEAK